MKIGAEARITVDYDPERAVAGYVSFVSPEAQFTPKQVETRSEREKLMFRVKIQVPQGARQPVRRAHQDRRPRRRLRQGGRLGASGRSGCRDLVAPEPSPQRALGSSRHGVASSAASPDAAGSRSSRSRTSRHRYGKVVALDDISLEIPQRHHGRHRRPRRRRQVDAAGADRRLEEDAAGQGDRPRRRHRRRPAPARRGPAHRVHAAGPGQEPLSGAQRPRQRRLHGAALRAVGRGARRRASRSCSRPPGSARFPIARPASSRAA